MTDHEVEVTLTPERIKLYERAMLIGLPSIIVSMYGDRIQKLIDDERNKVAQWMMAQGYATGHGDTTKDLLEELGAEIDDRIRAKVEAERERIIAANAPEIERVNAHIKTLEDAVKAEREACARGQA